MLHRSCPARSVTPQEGSGAKEGEPCGSSDAVLCKGVLSCRLRIYKWLAHGLFRFVFSPLTLSLALVLKLVEYCPGEPFQLPVDLRGGSGLARVIEELIEETPGGCA